MKLHYLRQQTDIGIFACSRRGIVACNSGNYTVIAKQKSGKGDILRYILYSRIFFKPKHAPQRSVLKSIIRMAQILRNYRSVAEMMIE